ncbi:MAG TPA: type II and III secretion system protein family protein, partial [Rhodopila sp.]|nr:type II and III secretion system protein family protein [Rhodopila sp.]
TLPHAAANVFVADSKVAEVRPASPTTLFVFGVATGRTTVAALDASGAVVSQFDVTVQPSTFGATRAEAEIRRMLPSSHVRVQALPGGLLLSGTVDAAADASQALVIARAYADKQTVENQITVRQSQQVTLKVRIAEMSRTLTRGLGIDWQALGAIGQIGKLPAFGATLNGSSVTALASVPISGTATAALTNGLGSAGASAALDFLSSAGLVRMLAEPNLTVISGQPASFLVGGQFPVPVPGTLGQTTIDYKNYGVSLSFVPTIFSDGRISIHVAPEVSQLSTANAVTVSSSGSSIIVPSLTVRRAETTVELGSGQSFAIAGLLQDSMTGNRSALPYLQDLPILGPAFRDDQFNRGETEIVILVTPYLVNPVNDPDALQIPTNGPITTDMDRMLYMRTAPGSNRRSLAATPDVAGFIVQ